MGDRWELNVACAYCNKTQEELVWYAPTCGSETFKCEKCGKESFITSDLIPKKIEDVTLDDVKDGFCNATNAAWTDEQIDKMCKKKLRQIKKNLRKK